MPTTKPDQPHTKTPSLTRTASTHRQGDLHPTLSPSMDLKVNQTHASLTLAPLNIRYSKQQRTRETTPQAPNTCRPRMKDHGTPPTSLGQLTKDDTTKGLRDIMSLSSGKLYNQMYQ
ncbi:Hypothetical predicted protein [Pelobates cultripes]|uniref:Uncharacterized protein n=1 Tax=Pelobates cultripes TaxID=61616 RepID=A0AAD1RVI6_PELCU|nr:Hypothetical predicted protein [Pelobates cultripes]